MVLLAERVEKELKAKCRAVILSDNFYVLPAFDYLIEEFLPWFRSHLSKRGMKYQKEKFDCDDFSQEFAAKLREAGLNLKEKAGVAVAIARVHPKKGEDHMLNLVGVNLKDGHKWLVVEPQNQKYVFLEKYTDADILYAMF